MNTYLCDVTPTDKMVVYTTGVQRQNERHLAVVLTNAKGEKISVLLDRDAAIELSNQISEFTLNGYRNPTF